MKSNSVFTVRITPSMYRIILYQLQEENMFIFYIM